MSLVVVYLKTELHLSSAGRQQLQQKQHANENHALKLLGGKKKKTTNQQRDPRIRKNPLQSATSCPMTSSAIQSPVQNRYLGHTECVSRSVLHNAKLQMGSL